MMNTHFNDIDLSNATILVVDDEVSNVKLIKGVLEAQNYKSIIEVTDSREVLEHCKNNYIDLILLDLNMPHLNGYEVMEQLRGYYAENMPPVLVLTAQDSIDFKKRAFDSGARDYVTKPFSIDEVLARVKNLLQVRLMHEQLENQNHYLEKKVKERTKEIFRTRLEVVRRLGRAAEYRDNETGLHIVRMSKISMLLGSAAGMSDYQADLLLNASPMHDIGKIGIPDHILLKPGKFEPDEWEIMKTHTVIGANILSGGGSDLLDMASEIAISHHEKWDGTGYPYNLEAEAIPLTGRISAIADVFDALTSVRPYKKAWAVDDAVDYINKQSAKQFDPQLVKYFNELLPDIIDVKNTYSEPKES